MLKIRPHDRRKAGRMKALIFLVPLAGAAAYVLYSKSKTARSPAYDEDWGWPESNDAKAASYSAAAIDPSVSTWPATSAQPASSSPESSARPAGSMAAGRVGSTGLSGVAPTSAGGANGDVIAARARDLIGKEIVDLNGDAIGSVEAVYYRQLSGEPEWLATDTGLTDSHRVLVPLDGATIDTEVKLAQAKAEVDTSPTIEAVVLDEDAEMSLYGHYGVRRTLPGVESERSSENISLREWRPAESRPSESA